MLSAIICDKNKSGREQLYRLLNSIYRGKVDILGEFDSIEPLNFFLMGDEHEPIDIAFVHTEFDEKHGADIAESIIKYQPAAQIIYITNETEHIKELYNVDFAYRLQEPLTVSELKKAVDRVENRTRRSEKEFLLIKNRDGMRKIKLSETIYFEKDKRRTRAVTDTGIYVFYCSFDSLMMELGREFVRCHNSYIVNMNRVDGIKAQSLQLSGNVDIPISRQHRTEIRELYMRLFK